MSRLSDAIASGGFADGLSPQLYLGYGGQNGLAPNPVEFASNQSYVRQKLVCLLLEAPLGFRYLPDPLFWTSSLKAMVERHALRIEGLKRGLTNTFTETPVGGGGEMQEDITNVTRERTQVSFTWKDKYGRPIQRMLEEWTNNLLMDPETKIPNIAMLATSPTDMLVDITSMTCLFFEPDPSYSSVQKAWIVSGMMPRGNGEEEGVRDMREENEPSELTIEFTGVATSNFGVRSFAQMMLNNINITNANPYLQPSFMQGVAADVAAFGQGYKEQAEAMGASALQRG